MIDLCPIVVQQHSQLRCRALTEAIDITFIYPTLHFIRDSRGWPGYLDIDGVSAWQRSAQKVTHRGTKTLQLEVICKRFPIPRSRLVRIEAAMAQYKHNISKWRTKIWYDVRSVAFDHVLNNRDIYLPQVFIFVVDRQVFTNPAKKYMTSCKNWRRTNHLTLQTKQQLPH